MVKGTTFNIQRYSIHDGPGIRTVVFLKGCTLACQWCSNPESIQAKPQLFYNKSKCIHCGNCVKAAPEGLITMDAQGVLEIDFNELNKLPLSWVDVCPTSALSIKGEQENVEDVFEQVMRDELYFRQSKGGVTLSGGEALRQADFSAALLRKFSEENISTAIETAGSVPFEAFEKVLPWTSLFLFDFKLFDADKHKKFIGVDNVLILENLKRLANCHPNIHVRMPLIPNINDDMENLKNTVSYLASLGLDRLSLLPFHQYGSNKYESIGERYLFGDTEPPSKEVIRMLNNYLIEQGFRID